MLTDGHKGKVLIADDEETIRLLLVEFLRSRGYNCTIAVNGEDALEKLKDGQFEAVLCDIQMPKMTGLEVLKETRNRGIDTTFVLVSAVHDTRRAIAALRLGAYDYIVKPFQLEEVELCVERALEHKRLVRENKQYQENLEQLVAERTSQLEGANTSLREKSESLESTVEELYTTYRGTLGVLCAALDLRDNETKGHSERVVTYSLKLGQELCFSTPEMMALEQGALLHDVGKIGVRDSILLKPGKLTAEEWIEMKRHVDYGENIIKKVPFLSGAMWVVSQHHEFYNGTGYPRGLKGDEIHINARIFSVADTLDAMTSDRPYRRALSFERAADEIRRYSGTQYDPKIAEAFLGVPLEEWRRIRERIDELQANQVEYVPDMHGFDLWQVLSR
jgi:response regulator RpfG family c-di-GMP phosphodiesterase